MVLGCVFFCFCTVSSSLSLLKFSILFDVFFFGVFGCGCGCGGRGNLYPL